MYELRDFLAIKRRRAVNLRKVVVKCSCLDQYLLFFFSSFHSNGAGM